MPTHHRDPLQARKFKSARTIMALMLREMTTSYGRSPGGYVWAILEPVGAVAMITLVLSVGLRIRIPSQGTSVVLLKHNRKVSLL